MTFDAPSLLGGAISLTGALSGQKRFDVAELVLLEGYEGLKQRDQRIPASARVNIREACERLVQLYEAWGNWDKAAEWKKKLEEFAKAAAVKKSTP